MGQGGSLSILDTGQRPRRYGFALTPLADAMFQLLIFFMLSSTLSPYSLIALTGGAPAGASAVVGLTDAAAPPPASPEVVIWHLSRGQIRAGDQVIALSDLNTLLPALDNIPELLIFPTRSATVQDIATVLERVGQRGVVRVRLVAGSQVRGN